MSKNVRETSKIAYRENQDRLKDQRWDVYDSLWNIKKPCTATELLVFMQAEGYRWTNVLRPQHQPRLTALVYGGSVSVIGVKTDPKTKQHSMVYDITGKLHDDLKMKRSYEKLKEEKKNETWNTFIEELILLHRDNGRDLDTRNWLKSVKRSDENIGQLTMF